MNAILHPINLNCDYAGYYAYISYIQYVSFDNKWMYGPMFWCIDIRNI